MPKTIPNIILSYSLITAVMLSGSLAYQGSCYLPIPKANQPTLKAISNVNQSSGTPGYQPKIDTAKMAQNELQYLLHEIMKTQVAPDPGLDKTIVDNLWDLYDHSFLG